MASHKYTVVVPQSMIDAFHAKFPQSVAEGYVRSMQQDVWIDPDDVRGYTHEGGQRYSRTIDQTPVLYDIDHARRTVTVVDPNA